MTSPTDTSDKRSEPDSVAASPAGTCEVVPGLSYKEYDARPGIRAGYLASVDRSTPGGAEYQRTHATETAAMRWGSALHCMVLEPDRFASEYTIGGPVNPKTQQPYGSETKAFNEWAVAQTKPILTRDEHRIIVGMADAIAAHPIARTIRDAPRQTELSLFWTLDDGMQCKARVDCLQDGWIWDVKTCRDAGYRGFQHSIAEYRYHMQAAWYLDGVTRAGLLNQSGPRCRVLWLAVENAPPYQLAVYQRSLDLLQIGHDANERALDVIRAREKARHWPTAYAQEVVMMNPPPWMAPNLED